MIKTLYITIGNIGSGKTTWVKDFIKGNPNTVVINKDDIRRMLHAGEYIYDEEIETEIHLGLLSFLDQFDSSLKDMIIDETNMSQKERADFIDYGDEFDYDIVGLVFPKLSREECVSRRMKNNHGDVPEEVWKEVWDKKNEEYEEPILEEGFDEIIYMKG